MFGRERSRSPPRNIPRGGDWFCPNCHDHQFAKNLVCRNCGTQKPDDPSLCAPPDAATFLKDHIIDDAVLSRFLQLDHQQQQVVIMRGSLSGARDPSAVLASRISQVNAGKGGFGTGGSKGGTVGGCGGVSSDMNNPMMQMMMQMMQMAGGVAPSAPAVTGPVVYNKGTGSRNGDWFCQQCGDHQFAKNALCRNCGAGRPTDGSESQPPSPDKFIAVHPGLEEHAIAKFRQLDPDSQLAVIKRGSLNGARDPNAVLLGRIKTVLQQGAGFGFGGQGSGGMGGGVGDGMGGGMGASMGTGMVGDMGVAAGSQGGVGMGGGMEQQMMMQMMQQMMLQSMQQQQGALQ